MNIPTFGYKIYLPFAYEDRGYMGYFVELDKG